MDAKAVSLIGVASYLPERVVTNDFFAPGAGARRGMFTAPTTRRHVARDETAVDMIAKASARLFAKLRLDPERDVDILFTNVALPDQAFTGCGAEVAHRIGCRPRWIVDLHNTGCVAFIYMMDLARSLMRANGAGGALLCTVQNAGGRVFADPDVRLTSPAPVPGDGCGVGYVAMSDVAPIRSLVHRCQPEFAGDMSAGAPDGRRYWERGTSPITLRFTDERVASIIERGNRIVPEIVK
jgi:3-oxoacyl-[acyl-carrier-protein] synthase-3